MNNMITDFLHWIHIASRSCTGDRNIRDRKIGSPIFLSAILLSLAYSPTFAADARIGFRGDGPGSFPDANPPVKWSAMENVVWKTPMAAADSKGTLGIGLSDLARRVR